MPGQDYHRDDPYGRRRPDERDRRDGRQDRGRGGPPNRPPVRGRRRPRWRRIFGIFFLVLALLLVGTWVYIDSSLNREQAIDQEYSGRPPAGEGTNWLIVGTDSREGLTADERRELATGDVDGAGAGKRTDTMMLLHIPDNGEKPTLVSLLRDSYLEIPGMGEDKLNAAYNAGSPRLLTKTVELNTGLRVDHYAEIGLAGFANVVDDVGGVNICVKERMVDPKAGLRVAPGCQDLDGPTALGYVRSRAVGDDYARVTRQRQFLSALMAEVSSPATLLNPFQVIPLLADAPDLITVNEEDHLHHLIGLAWAMKGAGSGEVVTTTVPFAGGGTSPSGASVVYWDEEGAQQMFKALNNDRPVPKSLISNTN